MKSGSGKMTNALRRRSSTCAAVIPCAIASFSRAVIVPIANGGFEAPITASFFAGEPPNWICPSGGLFGVLSPSALNAFDAGEYEGNQVAWTNSNPMEKRLAASIKGPGNWTLRWKVGRRPGVAAGVQVQFFAGPTLLGQLTDTLASLPPVRMMDERQISVQIPDNSPLVGSLLRVVVSKVPGGGTQANFDDFRLEADNPGPGCPADLNTDTFVEDVDFTLFVERYNELLVRPDGLGDLNYDAFVDDTDFTYFVAQYNELLCPA